MLTGSIINFAFIVAGALLGLLLRRFIKDSLKETVMQALGLVVLFVGIIGAAAGGLAIKEGALVSQSTLIMIFSLVLGAICGQLINIEKRLDALGAFCEKKFAGGSKGFSQGFVSATLLFAVGAMAVVGALENGLTGNFDVLLAKSCIDGSVALVLAATLGAGVAASAVPVFLYEGLIALLSSYLSPYLTAMVISQMSLVGSVLIFGIGLNMLNLTKLKVSNMLPAVFVPMLWQALTLLFSLF